MGCIHWHKSCNKSGYGVTYRNSRQYLAHRVSYCEYHGVSLDSIDGIVVRHTCDNRQCINPLHLLIGTQRDNMQDAVDRKRFPSGEYNHNARLSDSDVLCIRESYVKGSKEFGSPALARKYGVHKTTILRIVNDLARNINTPIIH